MEIKTLAKALKAVKTRKSHIAELETVKVENGKAYFSDLEIHCIAKTDLPDGQYKKEYLEKEVDVVEKEKNFHFNLDIPKKEDFTTVRTITPKEVERILRAILFTGNDDLRPVMKNVVLEKDKIVATDAHKMCFFSIDSPAVETNSVHIHKNIKALLTLFKKETFIVSESDKYISIRCEEINIIFRKSDGKYPNYEAVIPKRHTTTVSFDRKQLLGRLKLYRKLAPKATKQVRFSFRTGGAELRVVDIDQGIDESLKLDTLSFDGDSLQIGFNVDFMILAVESSKEKEVVFYLTEPNRAIIVDNQCLVMPMMIKS